MNLISNIPIAQQELRRILVTYFVMAVHITQLNAALTKAIARILIQNIRTVSALKFKSLGMVFASTILQVAIMTTAIVHVSTLCIQIAQLTTLL